MVQHTGRPVVGILFDPDSRSYRGILSGVSRYAADVGWELFFADYGLTSTGFRSFADMVRPFSGIIFDRPREGLSRRPRMPAVALAEHGLELGVPGVVPDQAAIGWQIADAFISRGFQSLAVFTTAQPEYREAERRAVAFCERAIERGQTMPAVFKKGRRTIRRGTWTLRDQLADLREFLIALPRPVGLLAIDPDHAWRALLVCRQANLHVPDDVAIISGNEDDLFLESLTPPITAMAADTLRAGQLAAEMLHDLMRGKRVTTRYLPPLGLIDRASSERLAIDDDLVAEAIRRIRRELEAGVTVDRLASDMGVSRRQLLRRFMAAVGRSPSEEIRRARLDAARVLLRTTDQPLGVIAVRSGFGLSSLMCRAIKVHTGMTPVQLRRAGRRRH